jgi:amino acid permease
MDDESTNTVTVTQPAMTVDLDTEPVCHTLAEYMLYKLDRTIAVIGLILIAAWVCWLKLPDGMQIVNTAVGGLIGYICGRTGK